LLELIFFKNHLFDDRYKKTLSGVLSHRIMQEWAMEKNRLKIQEIKPIVAKQGKEI
jgi:hypothetical protein